MANLSITYSTLERHEDALAMNERVLEIYRRVLPENHPDIGEGHVWIDVACTVSIVGGCLDFTCSHGHEQSCLNVLCPWTARGCACDEGKGARVHASRTS